MNIALVQLVSATLAAALFLLANLAFEKKVAARGRYLLGAILAISFLLPVRIPLFRVEIPESKLAQAGTEGEALAGTLFFPEASEKPGFTVGEGAQSEPQQKPAGQSTSKISQGIWAAVWAVYALGASITLFCTVYRYCRVVNSLRRCGRAPSERESEIFLKLCKKHGFRKSPALLVCPGYVLGSSVAYGFFRSKIAIADKFREEDAALILEHELTHCKRKDAFFKAVLALLSSLYWFNPIMHLFIREMEEICEQSCDETLLKNGGIDEKKRYCRLLIETACIKKAENKMMFSAFKGGKVKMKKRLNNIITEKNKKVTALVVCIALSLVAISSAVYAVVVPEPNSGESTFTGTIDTEEKHYPLSDSELKDIEKEIRTEREEVSSDYTDEENEAIIKEFTKYSTQNKTNGYIIDGEYKGMPSMMTKNGIPVIAVAINGEITMTCEVNPYTNEEGIVLNLVEQSDGSMTAEEISMGEYLKAYVKRYCSMLSYEEMIEFCETNGYNAEEWTSNSLFLENYVNKEGSYDFVKFYNELVALKQWENENFLTAWYSCGCELQDPASALRTYLARIGITIE